MRYKIIIGLLAVALVISLGFNVYFHSVMVSRQAEIGDMQGINIVTWARQMSVAAFYLDDATTNIDISGAISLLEIASDIAASAETPYENFTWQMSFTSIYVSEELGSYAEGYPIFVKIINSTAVEMIKNLSQEIRDTAGLILNESISGQDGSSFIQLLKEKGIANEIIAHCVDIQNLAHQIYDFNPKF